MYFIESGHKFVENFSRDYNYVWSVEVLEILLLKKLAKFQNNPRCLACMILPEVTRQKYRIEMSSPKKGFNEVLEGSVF